VHRAWHDDSLFVSSLYDSLLCELSLSLSLSLALDAQLALMLALMFTTLRLSSPAPRPPSALEQTDGIQVSLV
jgi:hypothetical protein